jgi:O-antigen/teichoic acid export membrane protein
VTNQSASDSAGLASAVKSGLAWSFLNNVSGRLISLAMGVVLARLLAPRDFGVFALAMVALNTLVSINDVGISATLVRWPGNTDEVAPTAGTLILSMSLVGYIVFFFATPWLCRLVHTPQATGVIRLLAVAVVIDGALAVPTASLTRSFRQDRRTVADVIGIVISAVVSIVLAAKGYGPWSLAWGRIAGNSVNAGLIAVFAQERIRFGFEIKAARALLAYGVPLAGSTLLTVAVLNTDYVVIGRLLGPTALGFYVLAYNISSWAVGFLSIGIQRVSIPAFARLQDDVDSLNESFTRGMVLLVVVTIPVCVLLSSLAHPVIAFVYGQRWGPAAPALRFLALFAIVRILQSLAYDALVAVGQAKSTVWLQGAWLSSLIPVLAIGAHLGGIRGVSVGHLAVGALVVVPLHLLVLRQIGIQLGGLGRRLVWPVVGGAMAVSGSLVSLMVAPQVAKLFVGGGVGLAAYGLTILPMRAFLRGGGRIDSAASPLPSESRVSTS